MTGCVALEGGTTNTQGRSYGASWTSLWSSFETTAPTVQTRAAPGVGEGTGLCFTERPAGGVASPHLTKGNGNGERHTANGQGSCTWGLRPQGLHVSSRLPPSVHAAQLSLRASQVKHKASLETTEEYIRKPGGGAKRPRCGLLGAILCPKPAPWGGGNACCG